MRAIHLSSTQANVSEMPKKGFQDGNRHGKDGRGGKLRRVDAGAPVPAPRSPRARRFRRARPLSCTPYRAGASDTATPAGIPAANAIETADFDQSMQSALPAVPPHHHDPPPTDSASLAYSQRTRAHVRQRLRGLAGRWCGPRGRYGVRHVLRDRTAACRACFTVIYSPHTQTTQRHSRFSRQLRLQSSDTPICGAAESVV